MHRRPLALVLFGWFVVDLGAVVALVALNVGTPRLMMSGLFGVLLGVGLLGVFPRDRDLPTLEDAKRTASIAQRCFIITGAVMIVPGFVGSIPRLVATLALGAAVAVDVAVFVWMSRRGVPLTDEMVDAQIAAGDAHPGLQMLAARPGRGGRIARRAVAGIGGIVVLGCIGLGVAGATVLVRAPSAPTRWVDLPVHYCIDTSMSGYMTDEDLEIAVDNAFFTWGVPYVSDGACAAPVRYGDEVSAIGWRELPHTKRHIALTTRWADCRFFCSGEKRRALGEADILIDPTPPDGFGESCFFAIVTHEVGHFLGLDHVPEPAVMYGECLSELTYRDLGALHDRYGDLAEPYVSEAAR